VESCCIYTHIRFVHCDDILTESYGICDDILTESYDICDDILTDTITVYVMISRLIKLLLTYHTGEL
jgi:hypothetical protein